MRKKNLAGFAGFMAAYCFSGVAGLIGLIVKITPQMNGAFDKNALSSYYARMPTHALLYSISYITISIFIGGILATAISGRRSIHAAIIAGVIWTLGIVVEQLYIGFPTWYFTTCVIFQLPMACLGYMVTRKK